MYLYKITNLISKSVYIGITSSKIYNRFSSHKNCAKRGLKTPLYDAMRKYGIQNFKIEIIKEFSNRIDLQNAEKEEILNYRNRKEVNVYNILDGGESYFPIKDKEAHRKLLKEKRKGRKPALGMKHTEENKKFFGLCGKLRWDKYGRYDRNEVLKYKFSIANKLFGISKTHYYRLLKMNIE